MPLMPQWNLKGDLLGACSCDWGCPCSFNARPTQGFCEGGYVWHVRSGTYDGIDLAGHGRGPASVENDQIAADARAVHLGNGLFGVEELRFREQPQIGAFSDRRVARLRRLSQGRVCTWMGRREILGLRAASFGLPAPRSPGACTEVPVRQGQLPLLDRRFVEGAHRRGVAVHAWTINERADVERLLDLGVDGILSDRPTMLKEVFVERGLWL